MRVVSIGFFVERGGAVIWRGPMVHKLLQQFIEDVEWGELDYLIVDLPPGTGDAQLSLSQLLPITGAVMVTTPQEVSIIDVEKALGMWQRVEVPVLGLIENMSGFVCPSCGHHEEIFLRGGGRRLAERAGIPFLGEVPLQPAVSRARRRGHAGRAGRSRARRSPRSSPASPARSPARCRCATALTPGRRRAQLQADADSLAASAPRGCYFCALLPSRFALIPLLVVVLASAGCDQPPDGVAPGTDGGGHFPWEDAAPMPDGAGGAGGAGPSRRRRRRRPGRRP